MQLLVAGSLFLVWAAQEVSRIAGSPRIVALLLLSFLQITSLKLLALGFLLAAGLLFPDGVDDGLVHSVPTDVIRLVRGTTAKAISDPSPVLVILYVV